MSWSIRWNDRASVLTLFLYTYRTITRRSFYGIHTASSKNFLNAIKDFWTTGISMEYCRSHIACNVALKYLLTQKVAIENSLFSN